MLNFSQFKKNEFVKNVLTLLSGTLIGQFFVFVITPLLTRLYSEELFGIFFIFTSTINILKKVTTLRLELAVILPKKDFWAINAFALSLFFTTLTSIIFFVIAILFKDILSSNNKISEISSYLTVIPVTLFFMGIYETFSAWNNRKKDYKKISFGKITFNFTAGGSQIGLYYTILKKSGLILGFVLGHIVAAFLIVLITIKDIWKHLKDIKIKRMKILLVRYKKIPTFNTLINFVTNVSNEIPVYLLAGFYSAGISGYYGMANRIVAAPMSMLSNSVGKVFYQKASEKHSNKQSFRQLTKKTFINLLKIGILPIAGITAISPFIYILLGEEWRGLTIYLLILIPSIITNLIMQPISSIPTIVNKQNYLLYFLIISTFIKTAAIGIGFWVFNSVFASLILFSIVTSLFRIFLTYWFYKIS